MPVHFHMYHSTIRKDETFLQDFLEILYTSEAIYLQINNHSGVINIFKS